MNGQYDKSRQKPSYLHSRHILRFNALLQCCLLNDRRLSAFLIGIRGMSAKFGLRAPCIRPVVFLTFLAHIPNTACDYKTVTYYDQLIVSVTFENIASRTIQAFSSLAFECRYITCHK